MTYADIFSRVRRKLNDVNPLYYRWPDAALRMYAGTVLRRMAEIAPQAVSAVRPMELQPGSLQQLPAWAVRFLGGVRRGVDGRSVRNVSPEVMDNVVPGWRDDPPSILTTDCIYDQAVPSEFSVYPPVPELPEMPEPDVDPDPDPDPDPVPDPDADPDVDPDVDPDEDETVYGPLELHIRASIYADDPEENDEDIPVNQVNEVALIHGVMALCFAEDTDAGDLGLAAQHWGQFYEAMGVQRQIDVENPPAAKEDKG